MRNKFSFYISYLEAINELPDEQQLQLYKAITRYALLDEMPENLTGFAKVCFPLIKPNIDSDNRRYDARVQNGNLGGRPKEEENKTEKPNKNLDITEQEPNINLDRKPNNNLTQTETKPNDNLTITEEEPNNNLSHNLNETEQKPNHNLHGKPNHSLDISMREKRENKETRKKNLDKKNLEREVTPSEIFSLSQKFVSKFPNKDATLPANLKLPSNFDIDKLLIKVGESDFLSKCNNLGLMWCIEHYADIVADKYKNYQPTQQQNPDALQKRKYSREEQESIFDNFNEIDL